MNSILNIRSREPINLTIMAVTVLFASIVCSHASLITFDFTGTVFQVDAPLAGSFSIGNTISGSYIFDSSVADQIPGDPTASFYTSSTPYSVTAGGFSSSGTGVNFNVFNELVIGSFFRDQYRAVLGTSGPSVNGYSYNGFSLDLFTTSAMSPTSSPITSDALLTTPLPIDSFDHNQLRFYFISPTGDVNYVIGSLSSLTVDSVPEPSSTLLLISGAAFFLWNLSSRRHGRYA